MNETKTINKPEQPYQKSGYCLSSWNIGSFYHCNPYHLQKEFLKSNKGIKEEPQRSKSLTLNKYGKVTLKPEDKIGKKSHKKQSMMICSEH